MARRKGVKPTEELPEEVEGDEEDELVEAEDEEVETDDEAEEAETEEDDVADDDAETEEDEGYTPLPDIDYVQAEAGEGFDFFATVHEDLKAALYVTNQAETKALLKYLHQMMFFNAFENGEHTIPGLGKITSEIKPSVVKTANFDMKNGTKKGEEYETSAKHLFKFKQSGSATNKLAEISEDEGWSPQEFLDSWDEEEDTEEA